ncbi:hypothetical protein NDU88_000507 [Pleurodeles waltl]|uniref:Uncharacterized protein n=1 Tax=Pleurodeles waltl TaxID=8319 RepID=A0AAV7NAP0_PLEWA|nr:hypothetical protein NDU88_000507 [Pleurodeles waltl]
MCLYCTEKTIPQVESDLCMMDDHSLKGRASPSSPCSATEEEFTIVLVTDGIKEEEESYPVAHQHHEDVKNPPNPVGDAVAASEISQDIMEKDKIRLQQESEDEQKNAEEEFKIVMISDGIKEEVEDYPVTGLGPEEAKHIPGGAVAASQSEIRNMSEKEPNSCSLKKHRSGHKIERHFICTECDKKFDTQALFEDEPVSKFCLVLIAFHGSSRTGEYLELFLMSEAR